MKNTFFKLLICAAICSAAAFAGCSTDGTSGTNGSNSEQPNTVTRSLTGDSTNDGNNDGDETPEMPNDIPDERPNDMPPPPPQPREKFPHGGGKHMPLPHGGGHSERKAPPEKEQTPSEENCAY